MNEIRLRGERVWQLKSKDASAKPLLHARDPAMAKLHEKAAEAPDHDEPSAVEQTEAMAAYVLGQARRALPKITPKIEHMEPGQVEHLPLSHTEIHSGQTRLRKERRSATNAANSTKMPNRDTKATRRKIQAARLHQQGQQLAVRDAKQQAQRKTKAAAAVLQKLGEAAAKAVKEAVSALIGLSGGAVLVVVLCAVLLAAALASSPMGILFADEASETTLREATATISAEYRAKLQAMQSGYDSCTVTGHAPSWRDVLAVFACKATEDADVITLDNERIDRLRAVFWDMTEIASAEVIVYHEDSDPDDDVDDSWTETVLAITVTAKTAEDMRTVYGFSKQQGEALDILLEELSDWTGHAGGLDITDVTALYCLDNLPPDLSNDRRAVLEYALSLVGRVQYFWGGKSLVLGDDPRWGVSTLVSAAGSPTTGTYRPYGLDCSGFVDWAFYNASGGSYVIGRGGGCISQHNNCYAISWAEAIPGDLVFYPGDSHIGIVAGWDEAGNILIVHCASGSQNGVYVTGQVGFTSIARPYYYQ